MSEHVTRAAGTATEDPAVRRPQPARRSATPAPRRGIVWIVALLLVGATVGYLLGYEEYSSRSTKAITPPACASPATGTGGTRLTGTVRSTDGRTLVLQEGTTTNVSIAMDAATVCRAVGARVDDVRVGQRVTVVGTRSADGAVSAAQVVITNETRAAPG